MNEIYSDDFSFCRNFDGLNILITGATGTIGSMVLDTILKNSQPANVSLFVRDDGSLPTQIQSMCKAPMGMGKRLHSYECDFVDPVKITAKVHQMLRGMNGKIDVIFFCHGLINFMGGIDGNLPEWDIIQKVNVRSTM